MTTYVALLRGINVSGRRIVPMRALREMAEGMGLDAVRTYIQSGNLIFASDLDQGALAEALTVEIQKRFGFAVDVALRSGTELDQAIAQCPFDYGDPKAIHLGFFVRQPQPGRIADLEDTIPEGRDAVVFSDHHVYINYQDGVHGSPLSNAFFERQLGVPVTLRNLNTVRTLRTMVDG